MGGDGREGSPTDEVGGGEREKEGAEDGKGRWGAKKIKNGDFVLHIYVPSVYVCLFS